MARIIVLVAATRAADAQEIYVPLTGLVALINVICVLTVLSAHVLSENKYLSEKKNFSRSFVSEISDQSF